MFDLRGLGWVLALAVFWIALQPNPWRRYAAIGEVTAGLLFGGAFFLVLLALPGLATRW